MRRSVRTARSDTSLKRQRRPSLRWRFRLVAVLLSPALCLAPARACDVPVYRYALEHWNPDAYEVLILHRGTMDAESQALAAALEKQARETPHANFIVRSIDADHPVDEAEGDLCASASCGDGPRLLVRIPGASQVRGVAWEGRLNADAVAAVTDSPCRREIARRLLASDAAVWVLLQTGRKEQDDAAAERIQDELGRPAADGQPPLSCSLVRVSRGDSAEKLLVETLLASEPDLRGRDEPMAFPVFGRGRVLYALAGAGINAENVRHALDFLVGGCSCTIKRQNPGVDLLLTADWSVITPTTPEEADAPDAPSDELVPLTPLPAAPGRAVAHRTTAESSPGPNLWLTAGVCVAAALVAATGWLALRSARRRAPRP